MSETQHAESPNHCGFSVASKLDEVSVSTHLSSFSHFENAIAHIQNILDQDDEEIFLFSLDDWIAYYSKTSELAALLKETQHPTLTERPQDVALVTRSTRHLTEPLANQAVLSSSLQSSSCLDMMPSRLLHVQWLSTNPPTAESKQEKTEVFDVEKHLIHVVKHHETKRTLGISKARKYSGLGRPRLYCYSGSMSTSKLRYHEKFVDTLMTGLPTFIHLHDMLMECGYAVGLNNMESATALACRLKQQTSPHGNAAERLAYYFVKALYARFQGIGWSLYTGRLSQHRPSSRQVLQARLKYMSSCPFARASHFFVNQTVLRVAKGASTLHIVDHQMTGFQYPSLFKELAALPGGPPKVHLVGQLVPHYSMMPEQGEVIYAALQKIGRRLSECAESLKVPFHFTPWVGARKDIGLQHYPSSKRGPGEVLVVISACFLRFVMDDIIDPRTVRMRNLKLTNDANTDVFIQGIVSGAYSSPFYSGRFKEALFHFTCIYDMLDTFIGRDDPDRLVFESEVLGRAIMNVVACEGLSEWGRVEKYKAWQAAVEEVGMQQLPMDKDMVIEVQGLLRSCHKDYLAAEDRQYLVMGWKGRILYALSAWKSPSRPRWPCLAQYNKA